MDRKHAVHRGVLRAGDAGFGLAVADVGGLSASFLVDSESLERALRVGLGAVGVDMRWRSHRFSPGGISLLGVADRARIALHTWPEHAALTVDLYVAVDPPDVTLRRCVEALLSAG